MNEQNPYMKWYPGALALARHMLGQADEAFDVTQGAILKTLDGKRLPTDERAQKVWFYTVVRRACLDWLRHEQRFDRGAEVTEVGAFTEQDADVELLSQQQRKNWMRSCLSALPRDQREILVLRDVNDLSYADIAEVLGIEQGTVMSRLHRARLALREKYLRHTASHAAQEKEGTV
ncbi:MAG: RNA polymerase sigma factor [Idiomarina sp.]|nr:RNA polymerase sigma factor [Idiomarina sp.]